MLLTQCSGNTPALCLGVIPGGSQDTKMPRINPRLVTCKAVSIYSIEYYLSGPRKETFKKEV